MMMSPCTGVAKPTQEVAKEVNGIAWSQGWSTQEGIGAVVCYAVVAFFSPRDCPGC